MRKLVVPAFLACALFAQAQDSPQSILDQAVRLADKYNWVDTRELFTRAEERFRVSGDERNALYARFGRLRSTMEERSLPALSAELEELLAEPLVVSDQQLRLFGLIVKGDVNGELDTDSAKRDWLAVRDLADQTGNARWKNRANGELGFQAFLEGDVTGARQLVAGALLGAVASGDRPAQARFMGAIGTGLSFTGIYAEALSYLDRALAVAAADPEMGYQFVVLDGKVSALRGLGRIEEAVKLAEELAMRARVDGKNVKLCQSLIRLARLAREQKDDQRALELLSEAIQLAEKGDFPRLLASAQFLMIETYRTTGDLQKAGELVATVAVATRNSGDLYLIPDRLRTLALLKMDLGEHEEANQLLTEATDYVDAMLANSPNPRAKAGLVIAMSTIYSDHASLLLRHFKDPRKAYEVIERARGRTLTDQLRSSSSTVGNTTLEKEFTALRLKIASARSPAQIRQVRNDLFIREVGRWLDSTPPLANASESGGPVPLDRLQGLLARDHVVLEYVLGNPYSYCLVLTKDGVSFVELADAETINDLAFQYVEGLKKQQIGTALSKRLFAELLSKVPSLQSARRLTIVADGQLHLLPFDTLTNPRGQYLVATHTTYVVPSASALYALEAESRPRAAPQSFLGIGGVPYNQDALRVALTRGYEAGSLGNLPGSEDEVITAAGLAKTKGSTTLLVGAKATEGAFKGADLARRSVIHLAVHGVANTERPDSAALILLSDAAAEEDGLLQFSEVLQLRINARLVVLSACDTAVGRLQGQDGAATLSRAFLLAGARSVVSTLWAVDDTVSAFLMKRFYQGIVNGRDAATALTQAKRDVIRTFGAKALPYHWGGFVLEGSAKPI